MKTFGLVWILAFACATASGLVRADVAPAPLFCDGMVLQQGKTIPVWGKASPGEKVTVVFADQTVSTTAREDGRWQVELQPLAASSQPGELVMSGKNILRIKDVLVGEVWLASGQSNMEWRVRDSYHGAFEDQTASHPQIRHFKTARATADLPMDTAQGQWTRAIPGKTGDFSGVGYYFALNLQQALNVPIGIIDSSYGGTWIEAWMDPDGARADASPTMALIRTRWAEKLKLYPPEKAAYDQALQEWEKEREASAKAGAAFAKRKPVPPRNGPGHQDTPFGLYNAMIHPHVPYALRGVIWYQGESNVVRASEYAELFSTLIASWRAQFGQGDIPFYWVQLASFHGFTGMDRVEWSGLREAQSKTLAVPNTGQAVAIDIGDVNDVHPRNKHEVGYRLALLALKRTYGKTELNDSGPQFAGTTREGSAMRVKFVSASTPLISPHGRQPAGFEIAGEDRHFYPAEATIEGVTVLVRSKEVSSPVAVRYAWRNAPDTGLYSQDGLPALPFRSDSW